MKKLTFIGLAVLGIIISISTQAIAYIIDFENPPYNTGSVNGQDSWNVPQGTADIIASGGIDNSQYLQLTGNVTQSTRSLDPLDTDGTTIEFNLYTGGSLNNADQFDIIFASSGGSNEAGGISIRNSDEEFYTQSGTWDSTGVYFSQGDWTKIKMTFNFTAQTYDVEYYSTIWHTIDTNIAFGAVVNCIEYMYVEAYGSGSDPIGSPVGIDEINGIAGAQAPEPTTLLMFGIGLVGLGKKYINKVFKQ